MASITPAMRQPGNMAVHRTLRRIPALRGLSTRELADVQERMTTHTYQAGDVIWRTHGPLHFHGYIQSGEIELETRVDGVPVRTTHIGAGDLLPPRALRTRRLHETQIARAVTDVRLGILPVLRERPAARAKAWRGWNWVWPMLLFLLVLLLARDDIARIASGLFYMASTREEAALQDPRSLRLLQAAQRVDSGAAFAYNEEGYRRFLQDQLPDASRAFDAAVARDPDSAPALNNLAVTYFIQGDLAQALSYLQRSMEQNPDQPTARYNLGITLMQRGDLTDALREFQAAAFIDDRDSLPLLQQAYLYQKEGDFANAEQRARSTIQLNPSITPAHLLLGMALYNQGRETEALASFENALMLEPGNRMAAFYQALILGHQKQYDTSLPILHELLASSTDASETVRILAEIDALYRFKAEPVPAGQ